MKKQEKLLNRRIAKNIDSMADLESLHEQFERQGKACGLCCCVIPNDVDWYCEICNNIYRQ